MLFKHLTKTGSGTKQMGTFKEKKIGGGKTGRKK